MLLILIHSTPLQQSALIYQKVKSILSVDLKGALVGTLMNEIKVAGAYKYKWTPTIELSSGMYLIELKTKRKTRHQKITYIK